MQWLLRYADPSIDWNYAMVGLVVRFIGVFVVMAVMQVALQGAAHAVKYIERRRATASLVSGSPAEPPASPGQAEAPDSRAAAAIALALEMERPAATPGTPSPWAIAGRLQQLSREPRG